MLQDLFLELASERQLEPDERLFRRGDKTGAIFSIISGRLRLLRYTADGRTITLHIARPGEPLAEAALFSDRYHCDAVADLRSRIWVYPKNAFLDKLQQQPQLAIQFIALQAQRIQKLRTLLELQHIRPARERVFQYLFLYGDGNAVELDRPLKAMASDIGLSHEAFYRALAELEQSGSIVRSQTSIHLTL